MTTISTSTCVCVCVFWKYHKPNSGTDHRSTDPQNGALYRKRGVLYKVEGGPKTAEKSEI